MASAKKMNPNEVQVKFRELVNYVAQGFYTDEFVVVLDIIVSVEYITFDEEDPYHYQNVLSGRLRTRTKRWILKKLKKLCNQHMILKDEFNKKEYYYINESGLASAKSPYWFRDLARTFAQRSRARLNLFFFDYVF